MSENSQELIMLGGDVAKDKRDMAFTDQQITLKQTLPSSCSKAVLRSVLLPTVKRGVQALLA